MDILDFASSAALQALQVLSECLLHCLVLQGVKQNSLHFVFGDFKASCGSRTTVLDIFQQPCFVDNITDLSFIPRFFLAA